MGTIHESPTVIGGADPNPHGNGAEITEVDARLRDPRVIWGMRVAWISIVVLAIISLIAALPYFRTRLLIEAQNFQVPLQTLGLSADTFVTLSFVRELILVLPGMLLGTLLYARRSTNRMVLLLSIAMVVFALTSGDAVFALPATWASVVYFFSVFGLTIMLTVILIMPDGRFHPRWCFLIVATYLVIELVHYYPFIDVLSVNRFNPAWRIIQLLFYAIGIGVQLYRYRHYYNAAQRQQTKWLIFGLSNVLLGYVLISLIRALWVVVPVAQPAAWFAQTQVIIPLLRIIPVLFAYVTLIFAVSRYRLWEVDLIINRGLVVIGLAGLLGIVFFAVVFVLQGVLQLVTGTAQSNVALVGSTLVIGTLFQPVRRRLQRFVDRKLFGIKVDFRHPRPAIPILNRKMTTAELPIRQYGEYMVTGILGRGGMGEVYRGVQATLSRDVAIKVLPANKAISDEARTRFEREARTVAALHHPNIIRVFDYGQQFDEAYMVMELVEGQSLDTYIKQYAPLSLEVIRAVMNDLCSALDYAHEQGLVHRDVKPSNVMLQPVTAQAHSGRRFDKRAILMDFGVARMITDTSHLTESGVLVGTFDYMAPEQITGGREVDRRADIYALGVLLFQMLTGKLPFVGDNPGIIIFAHLQRPAPDPREINPAIPSHFSVAVQRALAKQPELRFATAGELADALVG
ncbi:MAG: serine/threonine-protein kinase [Anaerolineae bacterium]